MSHFKLWAVLVVAVGVEAGADFEDHFEDHNSAIWVENDDKLMHCNDICCMARKDHLQYNVTDVGVNATTSRGLLMTMDNEPCKENSSACCVGDRCADYAAGHLSSVDTYQYGRFEWSHTRIGHGIEDADGPSNEFSCMSCYIDDPIHNEVALCVDHAAGNLHCSYWYNATMQRRIVDLNGTNLATSYHNYGFEWTPESVVFMLDDEVMWNVTNQDRKLIPQEPCHILVILRPHEDATYDGNAHMHVDRVRYTQLDNTKY